MTFRSWKRRHSVVGLITVSGVLLVIQLVAFASEQPRWPGWGGIFDWLGSWSLVLIAAVLAGGAILLHRRGKHSATTPAAPVRWVDGPDQLSLVARVAQPRAAGEPVSRPRWNWTAITSVITAFTAIGALVFTSLSLTATEQGQVTDRYTKAIDQIGAAGDEHLETRLGGIYALERLAHDSPRDQPTIIEVLSAFIRGNALHTTESAPLQAWACTSPAAVTLDIQAALTVLGRRDTSHDNRTQIDLHGVCMTGANLAGADLTGADLSATDLTGADLTGANLTDAHIDYTTLTRAHLGNAKLTHADLTRAHLTGADLTRADLTRAKLTFADLAGALLFNATHDADTVTDDAAKDGTTIGAWW